MAPRQGTGAGLEPIRSGLQFGVLDRLLGVGDSIKHMQNFMLGCVHCFSEVDPINGFLPSQIK